MGILPGIGGLLGGGPVPYEISFLAGNQSATNLSTYTYAGMSLGAEHWRRYILAVTIGQMSTSAGTPSSCTIAGISATPLFKRETGAASAVSYAFWLARVPNGASGDVVLNFGGTQAINGVALFRVINPPRLSLYASGSSAGASSQTLDVPAGGYGIGCAMWPSNTNHVWSGLTEAYDSNVGTSRVSFGLAGFPVGAAAQSVTVTPNGSTAPYLISL